jgi:hypothetical protein
MCAQGQAYTGVRVGELVDWGGGYPLKHSHTGMGSCKEQFVNWWTSVIPYWPDLTPA